MMKNDGLNQEEAAPLLNHNNNNARHSNNNNQNAASSTRQRRTPANDHAKKSPNMPKITTPYRDFPNATQQQQQQKFTPIVQLESFPATPSFHPPQQQQEQQQQKDEKKTLPLHRQVGNTCRQVVSTLCCCGPAIISSSYPNDNPQKYYQDDFNDAPWSCIFGTYEESGIWLNLSDQAGLIMSLLVWVLLLYSIFTITFLARTGGIPVALSMLYSVFCTMALACHAKTTLTDPGSIPASAVPTESQRRMAKLSMCSQCQTFKPPFSHHCRICNRCISRMDHHCPWMNNCIGSGNFKHFTLFLLYTWICSAFCLLLLGWNYFFCANEECTFVPVLLQLVRFMTILCLAAFLFTSSMLMNVCYGLLTGIGTIDRLKKKATNTMHISDEEPIPLKDVFGIGPLYTWPFPIDPLFEDYDRVMGYSTPQRLLREQMKAEEHGHVYSSSASVRHRASYDVNSVAGDPSVVSSALQPSHVNV